MIGGDGPAIEGGVGDWGCILWWVRRGISAKLMSARSRQRIRTIHVIAPVWKPRADFGVKSLCQKPVRTKCVPRRSGWPITSSLTPFPTNFPRGLAPSRRPGGRSADTGSGYWCYRCAPRLNCSLFCWTATANHFCLPWQNEPCTGQSELPVRPGFPVSVKRASTITACDRRVVYNCPPGRSSPLPACRRCQCSGSPAGCAGTRAIFRRQAAGPRRCGPIGVPSMTK
jgi:hypothetical protein